MCACVPVRVSGWVGCVHAHALKGRRARDVGACSPAQSTRSVEHAPPLPSPPCRPRSSWGQAERVASFLRQPARPRKGMPSKPIVGTAVSIQARRWGGRFSASWGLRACHARVHTKQGCGEAHRAPSCHFPIPIVRSWTWRMRSSRSSSPRAARDDGRHTAPQSARHGMAATHCFPPRSRHCSCCTVQH